MNSTGRKRGRPPRWTPEKIAEAKLQILEEMARGKSLNSICSSRRMPARSTVFEWIAADKDFADKYARAREAQAPITYEEIREIERRMLLPAMLPNPDYDAQEARKCRENKVNYAVPFELPNPDHINDRVGRVLIDSMKWRLARQDPKRFGDRVGVDHSGEVKHTHMKDQAPDWLTDDIAKEAGKEPPARPAAAAKPGDQAETTVH